jgi:hypothetical protein
VVRRVPEQTADELIEQKVREAEATGREVRAKAFLQTI